MTLSLEDVPVLPADVRLRVVATALDPDAPPVPATLVPFDTVEAGEAPQDGAPAAALDDPQSDQLASESHHDALNPIELAPDDGDPMDDDLW